MYHGSFVSNLRRRPWAPVRNELPGKRFVDDNRARRRFAVPLVDEPAFGDHGTKRPEVVGGADAKQCVSNLARRLLPSFDREPPRVADALERQRRSERDSLHSRKSADVGDNPIEEGRAFGSLRVLWLRQRNLHREQLVRVEAERHSVQVRQRSQHQACGEQQHQCGGHLQHDEAIAELPGRPAYAAARVLLQRLCRRCASGLERGSYAEEHAGDNRQRAGKHQQSPIENRCDRELKTGGDETLDERRGQPRNDQANRPTRR